MAGSALSVFCCICHAVVYSLVLETVVRVRDAAQTDRWIPLKGRCRLLAPDAGGGLSEPKPLGAATRLPNHFERLPYRIEPPITLDRLSIVVKLRLASRLSHPTNTTRGLSSTTTFAMHRNLESQ